MQKRFYIDTSVWIDLLEDRTDGIRPLGEFAFQFFERCKNCETRIIISDIVEKELLSLLSAELVQGIYSDFSGMIIRINSSEKQAEEARDFMKKTNYSFPFNDILHSIISRDGGAILVSRDNHFREINIVETKNPEELP